MELSLKNFRCHVDASYTLPAKGLILLNGPSGAGKSTILTAFIFALYGQIRKPYSHGATTCKVELSIKGLKISRTCKPNRLVVTANGKQYEDDAAQGVIDRAMMVGYDEFMVSSYIQQFSHGSVISLPPAQQIRLIESIAFSSGKYVDIRAKIKTMVKEKDAAVVRAQTQVEMLSQVIKRRVDETPDTTDLPDTASVDKCQAETDRLRKEITNATKKSAQLNRLLNEQVKREKQRQDAVDRLMALQAKRDGLQEQINDIDVSPIDHVYKRLEGNRAALKALQAHLKLKSDESSLEFMKQAHFDDLKKKHDELERSLLQPRDVNSATKALTELESSYDRCVAYEARQQLYITKISEAEDMIANIENAIASQLSTLSLLNRPVSLSNGGVLSDRLGVAIAKLKTEEGKHRRSMACPKCRSSVIVAHDHLELHAEGSSMVSEATAELISKTIDTLTKQQYTVADLESKLSEDPPEKTEDGDLDSLSGEIVELRAKLERHNSKKAEYSKIKREIDSKVLPASLQNLEARLKETKKNTKAVDTNLKERDLQKAIDQDSLETAMYEKSLSKIASLEESLGNIDGQMDEIVVDDEPLISEGTKSEINRLNDDLSRLNGELSEWINSLEISRKKREYDLYVEKTRRLQAEFTDQTKLASAAKKELEAAMTLESLNKKAEVLSVDNVVDSINENSKRHLERMFSDEINVTLENAKSTKSVNSDGTKTKIQISTHLQYKGSVYDSVDQLSGGERQRCNLAFLLAINEHIGSGVVILDECLNNLDSDTNYEILEYLKEYVQNECPDKLILVVSHEAVSGIFDHIVDV